MARIHRLQNDFINWLLFLPGVKPPQCSSGGRESAETFTCKTQPSARPSPLALGFNGQHSPSASIRETGAKEWARAPWTSPFCSR